MILWKLGIPDWARKTLWPISIGNRLEFTESLYNIHLNQVNMAKRNLQHVDKWIR
jgi:cytohesin/brefeldin A-inhibited guanine nucleotide-exchange protein